MFSKLYLYGCYRGFFPSFLFIFLGFLSFFFFFINLSNCFQFFKDLELHTSNRVAIIRDLVEFQSKQYQQVIFFIYLLFTEKLFPVM